MARDGVPVGPELAALVVAFDGGARINVTRESASLGVSTTTFYKYVDRFRDEGVEGFYPESRRPHTSPTRVDAVVEDALIRVRKELDDAGWDAGAEQIAFWLRDHPDAWPAGAKMPSRATINRILARRGQIKKVPQRRPKNAHRRFEAAHPNAMWQMDGFEFTLATGRRVVVLQISDDCSRLDLALRAVRSENAVDVWAAFVHASSTYGLPARLLTDNGTAFTGRRRGWISNLEENLRALGVHPICSSVAHPQTCGKNERAHATVRKWLRKQTPPATLSALQEQLDCYRRGYNNRRKTHLGGMTPAERYELGPVDGPGPAPAPWPVQISCHTVSSSGCIGLDRYLLGVGRRYAGQPVTLIRQHHQIAVFHSNQLAAEFTLTTTRRYQPRHR